jgi:hypothetical protein
MQGARIHAQRGTPMQEYQQRVVDEKADLDEKLSKLSVFIEGSFAGKMTFGELPEDEQKRLVRQQELMKGYSEILGARIDAFV